MQGLWHVSVTTAGEGAVAFTAVTLTRTCFQDQQLAKAVESQGAMPAGREGSYAGRQDQLQFGGTEDHFLQL